MITKHLLPLCFFAIFTGCQKDNNKSAINYAEVENSSIDFIDAVKIPITDLGKGTFMGFKGGLYPKGKNVPPADYAADLMRFASDIIPRRSNGKVDSTDKGKIGFISLGGSTCGRMMDALKNKTIGNPATNPFLKMVNCSNGGGQGSVNSLMNPDDPYWQHVNLVLATSHITKDQVQVVYMETEDSTNLVSFPQRPYLLRDEFEVALRLCKTKFPKLKLLYFLGRTTTFHKNDTPNIEPCPYYNGWAQKFVIEDQINGAAGTKYKGVNAVAPLVTWGWYEWADGTNVPRQDGFTWQESDTEDGLHATDAGEDTLSSRFQNFLLTDPYASIWYANHTEPGVKKSIKN